MDIIDNFSIINNKICLNSYKLVIRHYKDIDKKEFVDKDYYVNDDRLIELETAGPNTVSMSCGRRPALISSAIFSA